MKNNPILVAGMLAALVVGGIITYDRLLVKNGVSAENSTSEANEPAVETPAWMQDEDAIAAAEAVVKRKELEAENARLDAEVKALTETYNTEVERLEARQLEIEKELGF
jgi:hypothetical protein